MSLHHQNSAQWSNLLPKNVKWISIGGVKFSNLRALMGRPMLGGHQQAEDKRRPQESLVLPSGQNLRPILRETKQENIVGKILWILSAWLHKCTGQPKNIRWQSSSSTWRWCKPDTICCKLASGGVWVLLLGTDQDQVSFYQRYFSHRPLPASL